MVTNKPGEFRRLYAYQGGKLTPLGDDVKFDVDGFDVDRKRTRILYTIDEDGFTRLHALDARSHRALKVPVPADADHVYFGATTPDGRYTTIGVDDGTHPLHAFVLDWTAARLTPWHAPSTPEVDTTKFARAKLEWYPARDGTKIPVLVRQPATCAAPCPVVVSFHGGPESQARPGFSVGAQMFIDAGFVYAEPNVRGSDGYGKAWLHADDGPHRLDVITDIEDAAKWARTRFAANGAPPRVGIYGGSHGGYSVLIGMTMFAGAYDAGGRRRGHQRSSYLPAEHRALPAHPADQRVRGPGPRRRRAREALAHDVRRSRQGAGAHHARRESDPRVPAGEAIQIHDSIAAKGASCELMIFPDEGHGAQKRENRVLMLGNAIAFLAKHLAR